MSLAVAGYGEMAAEALDEAEAVVEFEEALGEAWEEWLRSRDVPADCA